MVIPVSPCHAVLLCCLEASGPETWSLLFFSPIVPAFTETAALVFKWFVTLYVSGVFPKAWTAIAFSLNRIFWKSSHPGFLVLHHCLCKSDSECHCFQPSIFFCCFLLSLRICDNFLMVFSSLTWEDKDRYFSSLCGHCWNPKYSSGTCSVGLCGSYT